MLQNCHSTNPPHQNACTQNLPKSAPTLNQTKLFIGGVPPDMPKAVLANLFLQQIKEGNFPECRLLETSTHKGFGFITLTGISEADIRENIPTLDLVYKGRKFDSRVAVDRKHSKESIEKNKDKKLLVTNLTDKITNIELESYFSQFGDLDRAYVAYDPDTGVHKGFGFILFVDFEAAYEVVDQEIHLIEGVQVKVTKNLLKNEYQTGGNKEDPYQKMEKFIMGCFNRLNINPETDQGKRIQQAASYQNFNTQNQGFAGAHPVYPQQPLQEPNRAHGFMQHQNCYNNFESQPQNSTYWNGEYYVEGDYQG